MSALVRLKRASERVSDSVTVRECVYAGCTHTQEGEREKERGEGEGESSVRSCLGETTSLERHKLSLSPRLAMATSTAAQTTAHAHTLDTAHAQATLDDDDREEGEIDDDGQEEGGAAEGAHDARTATVADTGLRRPPTTTPALSTSARESPSPHHLPPSSLRADCHRSLARAVLAVKEQSKQIIAELLTYGVSPEYLLSVGVSRDILEIRRVRVAFPSHAAMLTRA